MEKPLPPGRSGLPLVGETLALLANNYRFVSERIERHGPVFRSKVLGKDTVFLAGPEATAVFNDESRVTRAGSMPDFVEQFFGGKSLPLLDGPIHRERKEQVLAAFTPAALDSYVPAMQQTIEAFLDRRAAAGELRAADEFKELALDVIVQSMLGLTSGPELDTIRTGFAVLARGFSSLPIPLPGTAFTKALRARDRIFGVLRAVIRRHREHPSEDGLSLMLAARTADGSAMSDEHALLELHHFNIAGYLIYTLFCALLIELDRDPALRQRLLTEIESATKSGALPTGSLTTASLAALPELGRVVREAKRFTPFVTLFFGKSARDFEHAGYRIPAGWTVIWSQHATNFAPTSFTNPTRFDPDRFDDTRAEHKRHPCAFAPQGNGNHICAGADYSTVFLQIFLVVLLRGYTWKLPPQDLAYDYKKVPPEPTDALRVILTRRSHPPE